MAQQTELSVLKAMFDSMEQGVIFIDDGDRIAYCNPAAEMIRGFRKEEVIGKSVFDLHPAPSHSRIIRTIEELKSGSVKGHHRMNIQVVGGRFYDVTYSAVWGPENRYLGVIVTSQEVTERKKAEDELTRTLEELKAANEELKRLDQRKNDFFSNVSHELKTPMVSVIGYVGMMLKEKGGPLTEQQRRYLETSYKNLLKLERNIDELLELAELRIEKKPLLFEPVDLRRIIQFSCSTLEPIATKHQIQVGTQLPPEPVWISGVENKLNQLFDNLLSNAIKYNRPGGKIEVDLLRDMEFALIRIMDTGIGIPRQSLKEVFKRHFQERTVPLGNTKGLGIGLSLVQEIVELHQGKIHVESEVGKGTIFTLMLPVILSSESPANPPVSPAG
jgi:PAS domain S-box-containing protein